jgi:hypothetical protein
VREGIVAITAVSFEHTRVAAFRVRIAGVDRSAEAGAELVRSLTAPQLRHLFVISDGLLVSASDLVNGLSAALPTGVTLTGGFAGDRNFMRETYVWCDSEPEQGTAAALAFYGDRLLVGAAIGTGWDPFGPERLVTRSQRNVIYEFDSRPALNLFKEYLGENTQNLPASGLLLAMELAVGDNHDKVLRAVIGVDEDAQSITVAGDVPENAYVRMMFGSNEHVIDGAELAAQRSAELLGSVPPQLSLLVSCSGRHMLLSQRVEEEVEAVGDFLGERTTLTGFYSYGEIAPATYGGTVQLHNQTMAITSFAEL